MIMKPIYPHLFSLVLLICFFTYTSLDLHQIVWLEWWGVGIIGDKVFLNLKSPSPKAKFFQDDDWTMKLPTNEIHQFYATFNSY